MTKSSLDLYAAFEIAGSCGTVRPVMCCYIVFAMRTVLFHCVLAGVLYCVEPVVSGNQVHW